MDSGRPSKRQKMGTDAHPSYTNADEILTSLQNAANEDACISGEFSLSALTRLSIQFRVMTSETISAKDDRLILVCQWASLDPGFKYLFDMYNRATQRRSALYSLLPSLFCSILSLLNAHYSNHHHGFPIVKTWLSPPYIRKLASSLSSGMHHDVVFHTLRLLNALSAFSGGSERAILLELLIVDVKAFQKLLGMRRKTPARDALLRNPDIRTLAITYILSFLSTTSSTNVKTTFLSGHGAVFSSIFKELCHDPYDVAKYVLETCWTSFWSDARLSRTLKISVFSESTVHHILKLYERDSTEDTTEHSPAELAHHFLLAILTRPGVGLCFRDKGWYPKSDQPMSTDAEPGQIISNAPSTSMYNKILANVLKTLKVSEDARHQDLAIHILRSCPELVSGYWYASGLALAPRLSYRWITNMGFVGNLIDSDVPHETFFTSSNPSDSEPSSSHTASQHYNPSPPPLSVVLANIIPSTLTKSHLTKGLSSPSSSKQAPSNSLVRHCTVSVMIKTLSKMHAILELFAKISFSLEEEHHGSTSHGLGTTSSGQWSSRCREIIREMRNRVPEFGVVLAISKEALLEGTNADSHMPSLLRQMTQRLIYLYHVCLPDSIADTRFDPGKLLISTTGVFPSSMGASGFGTLMVLYILKTVGQCHEGWVLTDKPRGSSASYLSILLSTFSTSSSIALRRSARALLVDLLKRNPIFQMHSTGYNVDEISVWLEALQGDASEETQGTLISFFEECVQRCHKTPYRYLEEMDAMYNEALGVQRIDSDAGSASASLPSPLLMTVCEQYAHKLNGRTTAYQDPRNAQEMLGMLRRLMFGLLGCVDENGIHVILMLIDKLRSDLSFGQSSTLINFSEALETLQECMGLLRGIQPSSSKTVAGSQPPKSSTFAERYLHHLVSFDTVSSGLSSPPEAADQDLFLETLFERVSRQDLLSHIRRSVRILIHSLPIGLSLDESTLDHRLRALGAVIRRAQAALKKDDYTVLKAMLFGDQSTKLMSMLTTEYLSQSSCSVLENEILTILDSRSPSDQALVFGISEKWGVRLLFSVDPGDLPPPSPFPPVGMLWMPYMPTSILLEALDRISDLSPSLGRSPSAEVSNAVVNTLQARMDTKLAIELRARLPSLFGLRVQQLGDQQRLRLEGMITQIIARSSLSLFSSQNDPLETTSFPKLMQDACAKWRYTTQNWNKSLDEHLGALLVDFDQKDERWADAVVSALLTGAIPPETVAGWIQAEHTKLPPLTTCRISTGYCSLLRNTGRTPSPQYEDTYITLLPSLLRCMVQRTTFTGASALCAESIFTMAQIASPAFLSKTCGAIITYVGNSTSGPSASLFDLCDQLRSLNPAADHSSSMIQAALSYGLKWIVRCLSSNSLNEEVSHSLDALANLLKRTDLEASAFLVEPVFTAAIQHCLLQVSVINFCSSLLAVSKLKPVVVNRHLQSIIQHPNFFAACRFSPSNEELRESIVKFLYDLFMVHPWNASQASHLSPLIDIYHGSLAVADRRILAIFRLYEDNRKVSVGSLLGQWSASEGAAQKHDASAWRAICSFAPTQVLKTSLALPHRTTTEDFPTLHEDPRNSSYIDPLLCALLLFQMLSTSPPSSSLEWLEVLRTNVLGLLVRYLSCKDHGMRLIAYSCLGGLYAALQATELQETAQLTALFKLLRDQLLPQGQDFPRRLSSYTTLLLCHALRGIFFPTGFTYHLTAKFLLQRPELDATDVPLLFSMLYSSSSEWRKERTWLIHFVSQGALGSKEWKVLKRRHTWDLLASLFEASPDDLGVRNGVLECLTNLTCNSQVSTELVGRHGLLAFVEMQLSASLLHGEAIPWLRILENIIVTGDAQRLDTSSQGRWRISIISCLELLLVKAPSLMFAALPQVLLRLLLAPGGQLVGTQNLLNSILAQLHLYEAGLTDIKNTSGARRDVRHGPPYRSQAPRDLLSEMHSLEVWGVCVEVSWRCAMETGDKGQIDALTYRLLVWRSIRGSWRTSEGQWAEHEVLKGLSRCLD